MNRTLRRTVTVAATAGMAFALSVGMPSGSIEGSAATNQKFPVVTHAAYTTSGSSVEITAEDRAQGITEGVAFSNGLGTVTVLSDSAHRARRITVTTLYKGLTVKFKSRGSYNYSCTARQQLCTPDRPYAWSWLQFTDVEGAQTIRLNPGIGESIPQLVNYEGKPSFVFAGQRITARMMLTTDGRVTFVKALETNEGAGSWKFFLRTGGTVSLSSGKTAGFKVPVNAYKIEEIDKSTGQPQVGNTIWTEDVMGLAAQAEAAGK